jgi:hypothetical protein
MVVTARGPARGIGDRRRCLHSIGEHRAKRVNAGEHTGKHKFSRRE